MPLARTPPIDKNKDTGEAENRNITTRTRHKVPEREKILRKFYDNIDNQDYTPFENLNLPSSSINPTAPSNSSRLLHTPLPNLVKTPEQISPSLSNITVLSESINSLLRSNQSQVVIEDLKTNEVFIPNTSLIRHSTQKNFTFEEYLKASPLRFDKTIKIESPELLKQLQEDKFFIKLNIDPTYTFPLRKGEHNRKSSSLTALTHTVKPNSIEFKSIKRTFSKRSLNFDLTPSESDSDEEPEIKTKMAFNIGDILKAVPTFDGKEKDLDTFINICESFNDIADEELKEQLVTVFKMKIIGRALSLIQPTSELDTWARIKNKLEETFKKPVTYELAQYELAMIKQKRNESMEDYSERILKGLEKLNNASKNLSKLPEAFLGMQEANARQALQHFEQNIYNDDLRIRVDSANKKDLREAILFAKQKEISLRLNTQKTCDFCKMSGHEVTDCRKKNSNQPQAGTSRQFYRNNGGPNTNRFNARNPRYDNGRNNNYNNDRFNYNYGNNNNSNRFNNNYGNNGNNRYNNNNNYRYNNNNNGNNYRNNNNGNNATNNTTGGPRPNNTAYRNNSPPNNGNNTNRNMNNPTQGGYYRNNNGNNTTNNYEGNNQRNNYGNNNNNNSGGNQRAPNYQNNRGNINSLQEAANQQEYGMVQPMTTSTTAQVHQKN